MKHQIRYPLFAVSLLAAPGAFAQVTLEEIVVTAQFREQSLQDAGLAIDAATGADLIKAGITNVSDLSSLVPALTITDGGGIAGQLYMRGVGNTANNDYLDPAIILTVDGVPIARGSATAVGAFYDLERVEVLKGPQGTLYGKNATGGVLNIIPVKPVIGEIGGFVSAGFGNYSAKEVSGAFNLPIGDNSALRIAGSSVERDGYNKDGTNDDDKQSFRLQFLTEVNDRLSVRLATDRTEIGSVGSGGTPVGSYSRTGLGSFDFVPSGIAPNEGTNTADGNAFRESVLAAPGFGFLSPVQDDWYVDATLTGYNAEIKYSADFGEITIIPGIRKSEQDSMFGGPGFNSGWWQTETEQKTLEARFAGKGGELLNYMIGAFYFEEDVEGNNTFNQEFVLPLQDYTQESESKAVFTELTWNLNDSTRLITGARYTDDYKALNGSVDNFITFCGGIPPNLITPPASFAQGCHIPGNLPRYPTLDTVEQAQQWLVDQGWVSQAAIDSGSPVLPLLNGVGQILHGTSTVAQDYEKQKATYRISLEKDVANDSLVYFAFETGYRSGGLEPNDAPVYQPEFLDAWTLGSKNRLMGGRLQLNAEIFYWDYTDQQISYFSLNDEGVLQNSTQNVGAATSKGVDLDTKWLAADNTLVTAKLQYLKASYDDLHFRTTTPRDNINCPFTIIGTTPGGTPDMDFDCSGNQAIYSPEWTVMLGVEHTFPIGSMNLIAAVDTRWVDDQVAGFNNHEHANIESYWTTNVNLTLVSADNHWSVSAYARNLEDENRQQSSQSVPLGMALNQYGPDMTYGMRFNYNF